MAQLNFKIESDIIKKFLSETTRNEGVRELNELFLNRLLKFQSDEQIGVENYQRNVEQRKDYCNGEFKTEIFQKFQRSEQVLLSSMMQMAIDGVSTRKIENITKKLCGITYSKTTVSSICKNLTDLLETWKERDLSNSSYPFIDWIK